MWKSLGNKRVLMPFHILSTVQFWDRSVWQTKNTKVHLKKFNYTLGLTLQTFPHNLYVKYIFIAVLNKTTLVKVTWILFTNCKCYFVANPSNWLNIIKATTVFENEYKVEMHFKQSDKIPPFAIKLHMHNLIVNEIYFVYK